MNNITRISGGFIPGFVYIERLLGNKIVINATIRYGLEDLEINQ